MSVAAFHLGLKGKLDELDDIITNDTAIYHKGYTAGELRKLLIQDEIPKIFNKMSTNGIDDRKNTYTVTNGESGAVNADIVIRYTPICKFGLL
jgi:hypothetical protein